MPPALFNWAEIFSRIFSCSALSGSRKRYHRASCSASALLISASVGNLSMLIVPILLTANVMPQRRFYSERCVASEAPSSIIAISHIRPSLASGWMSGRRLSGAENCSGSYCGSPTLCTNSANRGSERIGSSWKSVLNDSRPPSRS